MDKNFVVHERSAFTPFHVKVAPITSKDFKNERSQKKNAFAFIKRMFQPPKINLTCNDASSRPDTTISLK
jgi:hypothetical protein